MHVLPSRTALAAALAIALGASAPATSATHTVTAAQPSVATIDAARSDPHQLILQAGAFDPAAQVLDASSVGAGSATLSSYAIVQFQPGHLDERKALVARGVQFLGYIPNNAYYVRLNGLGLSELAHHPAIRWAGVVQPAMKLDPQLWQARRADSAARQENGRYEIIVHGFAGVASAHIAATLQKLVPGVRITARSERAEAAPYVRAAMVPRTCICAQLAGLSGRVLGGHNRFRSRSSSRVAST